MDDEVAEVSGYWANLNHPSVEVEDTAVAILRFRDGGLGSIVTSLSQKPGIHTKVHIHGSNGALGRRRDRPRRHVHRRRDPRSPSRRSTTSGPIPGEEDLLARFRGGRPGAVRGRSTPTTHYHALQIEDFLQAILEDRPPR